MNMAVASNKRISTHHDKQVHISSKEDAPVVDTILVEFDHGKFQNPHHWPASQKWSILVLNTINLFLMNVSVTVVAPALDVISRDLGMDSSFEGPLVMSTYILALSLGPLLLGPLSELYGRVPLMLMGNSVYIVFNLVCGFVHTKAQLMTCRVLSGLGGGAAPVVALAMISDCFNNEERGKPVAAVNAAFVLATPVGAIVGAFSTQSISWRVSFYITTGVIGLTTLVSVFVYRESYPPVLLHRKKKHLHKQNPSEHYKTPYDDLHPTVADLYYKTIIRPLYMLATQPALQAIALYVAYTYGLTYLIFSTFPTLWEQHYGEPKNIASLHYVAAGIGYFIGIQICMGCADRFYRVLKRRNNDVEKAEFRLPLTAIPAVLLPAGLFCYGWTAEYKVHWAGPSVSIAVVMCGCTIVFQNTAAYMMEAYTLYNASVSAATYLCRGICAFVLPLFGPTMYDRLGYGWVGTILGFLALFFAWVVPLLLWFFGERLRKKSSFATGGRTPSSH